MELEEYSDAYQRVTPFEPEDPGTFYPTLPEIESDQEMLDVFKARQQLRERKRRQWLLGGYCYQ